MNSSVTKFHISDREFPTGSCKKQRKRHRNRYKHLNLKRKRLKKYFCSSKTGFKSGIFNLKSVGEKNMSDWYWSNYRKAVEWQERHKVAHWKACALALLEENRYLLGIINHMQPGLVSGSSATSQGVGRGINFNNQQTKRNFSMYFPNNDLNNISQDSSYCKEDENNDNSEEADDDFEFEMSEEMIQYFKQSYKHKMDRKKLEEKEEINKIEQQVQQIQTNKIKRSTEMNFLYGDGASMITGMETAVQLSFNKYCDSKSPKFWPNIPFRL